MVITRFLFRARALVCFGVRACVNIFCASRFTDIDDCLPNPCHNNGVCLDGDGQFTCKCAIGWTGKLTLFLSLLALSLSFHEYNFI